MDRDFPGERIDGEEILYHELVAPRSLVLHGGLLYVADGGSAAIWVYDSTGGLAGRIGQRGGGPSEFQSIGTIDVVDNRLYVLDPGQRRVSIFQLSSTRTPQLVGDFPIIQHPVAWQLEVGSEGEVWVETFEFVGQFSGKNIRIRRFDNEGAETASLRPLKSREQVIMVGPGLLWPVLPFDTNWVWTVDNSGRLWLADPVSYKMVVHDRQLSVVDSIHRRLDPIEISEDEKRSWFEEARLQVTFNGRNPSEELYSEIEFPATKGFFTRLTVDAQNRIWAWRTVEGDLLPAFDVFSADGAFLATITLPVQGQLAQIAVDGTNLYLLVELDEVPQLVRATIVGPPPLLAALQ